MSGLLETIISSSDVDGTAGALVLQGVDAGINAMASAAGVGSVLNAIIGLLTPSAASGPSLTDLQNQMSAFQSTVTTQLAQMGANAAGGQVQLWANNLQQVLEGPDGVLSVIPEITDWKKNPGLPLPDGFNPSSTQCQIWARAALDQLIGSTSAPPPDCPPTSYWYLPAGDFPLFKPDNPWTYLGTTKMFNKPYYDDDVGDGIFNDSNPYTGGGPAPLPSFDLSLFQFTNDFSPTPVPGVPQNNAFNPTWILQQSMLAVTYYLILCGAVMKNFPNDGATVLDFTSQSATNSNFLGGLSWYHDQIRAGIVCISPPFPTDIAPDADGVSTWSVPCAYSVDPSTPPNFTSAPSSLWSRPFGALCNYNSFVAGYGRPQPSVDGYPDYVYAWQPGEAPPSNSQSVSPQPPYASPAWYTGFYGKYLVACLWRVKLVYNLMGLADMWRTINNLYVMFGQPPRTGPCFGDWSLREVFGVLGSANYATFPLPAQDPAGVVGYKNHVRAFLQFMNSAAPTPATPVLSLRATLQA